MEENNQPDNNDEVNVEPHPQVELTKENVNTNDCFPNDDAKVEIQTSGETPSTSNEPEKINEIAEPLYGVRLENLHKSLQGPFMWQPIFNVKTYCKQDIESLLSEVNELSEEIAGFQLRR